MPIKTELGYHLFLVEEFIPAELTPEREKEIKQKMFQQWLGSELNYMLHSLTDYLTLQINRTLITYLAASLYLLVYLVVYLHFCPLLIMLGWKIPWNAALVAFMLAASGFAVPFPWFHIKVPVTDQILPFAIIPSREVTIIYALAYFSPVLLYPWKKKSS